MKFSLLAALTIGCLSGSTNVITDQFGNRGIGENNVYEGSGNNWIGNRNSIRGVDNGVKGDDNTVRGLNNQIDGNVNNVEGKDNYIVGGENKISGQNNIVHGTGNIIGSNIQDIPFDIESRLPAWMRSKIPKKQNNEIKTSNTDTKNTNVVIGEQNKVTGENNKVQGTGNIVINSTSNIPPEIKNKLPLWLKNKVAQRQLSQIQVPQERPTTSTSVPTIDTPMIDQTNQTLKSNSTIPVGPIVTSPIISIPTVPSPPNIQINPQIQRIPQTLPPVPHVPQNFNAQDISQYQTERKPSFRQIIKSPGKTQIRQVYITPNSRQEVISSFSTNSNYIPEKNPIDWNKNKQSELNAWNRINNAWKPNLTNDWRKAANPWNTGVNNWNMGANNWNRAINPNNLYYPSNPLVQHRWNNNDVQNWGAQMRQNTERSVQDLRARIQSQVQQSIDRAFGRTFY